MNENRKIQFQKAAETYVNSIKSNPDVIGVIVTGSFIHSIIDKNSDIDIFIILHPDCDYRERGNTWVNGVEVEYFMNPPQQIRVYYQLEKRDPVTAHLMANGRVAYHDSSEVRTLIREANEVLNSLDRSMTSFEKELGKYFIDDLFKDMEDVMLRNDKLATQLIKNEIIEKCISIFFQAHQVKREKEKRLKKQLLAIDKKFAQTLELSLQSNKTGSLNLKQLRAQTEALLGGARTKEWKLRSPLRL